MGGGFGRVLYTRGAAALGAGKGGACAYVYVCVGGCVVGGDVCVW